ncbi:MAG: hypothetical protein GY704_14075, partial [Phycisphaeraceae bacterium]|nr:hypothetical protein [Phycisphaeraceae bacterium]
IECVLVNGFGAFVEGVKAIGAACRGIGRMSEEDLAAEPTDPIPVISGNVSFYNESSRGAAIPPSPIVALAGRVTDVSRVPGQQFKQTGDPVFLIGERKDELGGGVYNRLVYDTKGGQLPEPDFGKVRAEALVMIQSVQAGWVKAAHDIAEGGLAVCLVEMMLGRRPETGRGLAC